MSHLFKIWSSKKSIQSLTRQIPSGGASLGTTVLVVRLSEIPSATLNGNGRMSALEHYYAAVADEISDYGGVAYPVEPGAILVFFPGTGISPWDVQRGVQAAFAVMERLTCLNDQRLQENKLPYRVGLGLHTGDRVVSGKEALGRLSNNVDQADVLSHLNQQTPFPAIFINQNARSALADCPGYYIQDLGETTVNDQTPTLSILAVMPAKSIP